MTYLMMGETDYKDADYTEQDFQELDKALAEGERKRKLAQTPEGRRQLAQEREKAKGG